MNLKQFLKPDFRKIVIFIIFVILSVIIPFRYILGPWVDTGPIFNYESIVCGEEPFSCSPQIFLPYMIFNLAFFYLLSCFIVWIYDKFRKRK